MNLDRRAEIISAVLTALLTVACLWCALTLTRLSTPALAACGCDLPYAAQYVFDFAEQPFSMRGVPWLGGALLFAVGRLLRRHTVGLVALFAAPLAPLAMLTLTSISLMLPLISIAVSGTLNT